MSPPRRSLWRRAAKLRDRLGAHESFRPTSTSRRRWRASMGSSSCSSTTRRYPRSLNDRLAILMLTHVNYRTGRMHDMAGVTARRARRRRDHDLGPGPLGGGRARPSHHRRRGRDPDFAVGCGYKYLNGGPGAPAFAWAHPRHIAWMDRIGWRQPLSGWLGHAAPFEFTQDYRPAAGMARFICGTPPVLSLAALECGVDTVLAAEGRGGLAAIRQKSIALTDLFIALVESRCAGLGLELVTPRDAGARGSQVSFAHPAGGYAVMQALIARGADRRLPSARHPALWLYTALHPVRRCVGCGRSVARGPEGEEWRDPRFNVRAAVT